MKRLLVYAALLLVSTPAWAETNLQDRIQDMESQLDSLKRQVEDLRGRATLLGLSEEVKQIKQYVCPRGHLFDAPQTDNRCPTDGAKVRERVSYRKVKLARQESIGEKIEAALADEAKKSVAVGASATGITQQIGKSGISGTTDRLFSSGSVDLFFVSRPAAFSTLFIDLEGAGGMGPDQLLGTMSGLNDDAGRVVAPEDKVMLREAWLSFEFGKRRFRFTAGKVDLANYFDANRVANDETTQFLSSPFVNNPVLETQANGPGAALFYDPGRTFYAGVGVQSESGSGSVPYKQIYSIAELGARLNWLFHKDGNYRIWGRSHGQLGIYERAVGVSVDQRLSSRVMLFGRCGGTGRGYVDRTFAWSAGLSYSGPFHRSKDEIAAAYGSVNQRTVGGERIAEAYYRAFLTEHLAVTPNVQGVFRSDVLVGGLPLADPALVFGLRTQIEF